MKKFWKKNIRSREPRSSSDREQSLRFFQRIPANGLVRIQSSTKDYSGFLVNISREGLMSKARDLPDPNEEITMSFRLLPHKRVYHMKGIVIWTAPRTEPDWFKRMGVRFLDQGTEERKQMREYISRIPDS
jgi:hypothetical protein